MADPQNLNASAQNRPHGQGFGNASQQVYGSGFTSQPGPPTSMMTKGPSNNGPVPAPGQSPFMNRPSMPGVNGFNASAPGSLSQRPPQPFTNGPATGPPSSSAQPGMPPPPGLFRPQGLPSAGQVQGFQSPPGSAAMSHMPPGPPDFSTAHGPTNMVRPPTISHPAPSHNQTLNPVSTSAQAVRPNELPVPFHGHGQYSHQVGMTLTPGITPANSGPPSQRSSRTNSPIVQQNFDALEGQFRNTPDQEKPPGPPGPAGRPPGTMPQWQPQMGPQPGVSTGGQVRMPSPSSSMGQQPQPGFQPVQRPGFPPSNTAQRPGFPPAPVSNSDQHGTMPGSGPRPGFAPSSVPGQHPGQQPPAGSWQHNAMSMAVAPPGQGTPPMVGQQPGFAPPSSSAGQPNFMRPPMSTNQPGFQQPPSTSGQLPGFPPAASMANQRPGFPPTVSARPGFPPQPTAVNQRPGFPPPLTVGSQRPGFAPPSTSANQQPGFPPPPPSSNQQPGFPPPSSNHQPGFPPPPPSSNQQPGFPPPSTSLNQQPGFPPTSANVQQPGFPPPPTSSQPSRLPPPHSTNQQPGFPPSHGTFPQPGAQQPGPGPGQPTRPTPSQPPTGQSIEQFVNTYPKPQPNVNSMTSNFGNMAVQGGNALNLLQQKQLIPAEGVEIPKPAIPNDYKNVNCSPEVFRCTLNSIPQTSGLLNKARLPLGILLHPFKDLSQLPVIQSSVIVRCRSCRTYINPFVYFVDSRRWKCNLCYRVNELPDEFSFDPVTKTYGDPQRRPEVRSATIEFIAPSEYMLRPPQPAVYLYLLDVSFNAIETGYLEVFCETLLDNLDRIPGDSRTQIGFVAYDSCVHFFNLDDGLSQPQMLTVSDVDDIFLPVPDNLLVNLNESKSLVIELLNQLPTLFKGNLETGSALGAALQAAYKMMHSTGGRVSVMQTTLPTVGPGALHNREDASGKAAKDVPNLGPATDFYKKLALDCSAQQIGVDIFMFNAQYIDMASIECISRFSAGSAYYYPSYHSVRAPQLCDKFETDLRRYLTRKIGFESVMRIRCSKGISIHTFHGNFFVRSTDLLSLPNVSPDVGFAMQMSIEEALTDMSTMCFQAALLYTSSKGERRIRVHTLCLPVTNQLSEVHAHADQEAIISLLAKMAVDRSLSSSMSDAREAIVNAAIDSLSAYASTMPSAKGMGGLFINEQLRLMPLYCLALLKSTAFRSGVSTKLDDRSYALQQCKTLPTSHLMQLLYPDLYPLHTIMEVEVEKKNGSEVAKLPLLQLSSANIDRFGAYLLDAGDMMFIYIGSAINPSFCADMLDAPDYASLQEGGISELPELDNEGSERLRGFVSYLLENRPNGTSLFIVKEDGRARLHFFQHFVEDRTESSMSYHEFLQNIQKQVKS